MRSGELRHLITIEKLEKKQDENTGNITDEWTLLKKTYAKIHPLSGKEFLSSGAIQSEIDTKITIRHDSRVKPTMRIKHRDVIYNIEAVLPDPKSGLEYLTLLCKSGLNNG